MIIDKIKIQFQSDTNYADEIMTFPVWQNKPDTIKQYGCLLCAKLNAYNFFNKDCDFMNIKQFNDKIIKNKGYNYLYFMDLFNGNENKTKAECYGKESFQRPDIINNILGIIKEQKNYTSKIDIKSKYNFYILKSKFQDTGHYSLIIQNDKLCVDSYDGNLKYFNEILDIIKITFGEII